MLQSCATCSEMLTLLLTLLLLLMLLLMLLLLLMCIRGLVPELMHADVLHCTVCG